MTYLAACTVATLLLAVFISASFFTHLIREKQHKRHQRDRHEIWKRLAETLRAAEKQTVDLRTMRDVNAAGLRLDETMRRTISEGIELARLLDSKNQEFAALVAARKAQRDQEDSTLLQWMKIRDDLEAFYEAYPAYLFTGGGQG